MTVSLKCNGGGIRSSAGELRPRAVDKTVERRCKQRWSFARRRVSRCFSGSFAGLRCGL